MLLALSCVCSAAPAHVESALVVQHHSVKGLLQPACDDWISGRGALLSLFQHICIIAFIFGLGLKHSHVLCVEPQHLHILRNIVAAGQIGVNGHAGVLHMRMQTLSKTKSRS